MQIADLLRHKGTTVVTIGPDAEDGPNHIAEHLPRLVEWSEELRGR